MEPSKGQKQSVMEPKTFLDMLPELSGILSKESMAMLTAKKKARNTTAMSCKSEIKPMTLAEMMPHLQGFRVPPTNTKTSSTAVTKKPWISSVKTDSKRINEKTKESLRNSSVRKVLNFQSKPKPQIIDRTPLVAKTPKFKKPEIRIRPELSRVNNVRISGIASIDQTPNCNSKSENFVAESQNKKNFPLINSDESFFIESNKKKIVLPNKTLHALTPNTSSRSNNDTTFLQKEEEINKLEEKITAMVCDERSLENIEEVSPPTSTPFTEYRNVEECLHNSSIFENSANFNNTIMCFDKTSTALENNKKEESMIVSLCDLLDKASVKNTKVSSCHELKELLELKKQIECSLELLMKTKDNHEKALLKINELIQAKRNNMSLESLNMSTTVTASVQKVVKNNGDIMISESKTKSILISKTPTKKIANQGQCLRRTVLHKSMPAGLNELMDHPKVQVNDKDPAACIYKELKQSMNFLHTPMKKRPQQAVPDTPAVTSHNIQKQLLRLYEN